MPHRLGEKLIMKAKKQFIHLIVITVVALSFLPMSAHAAEGGEVGNGAGVEFYSESSSTSPSSSDLPNTKKPTGNLPQTGEIVKKSMMLSGVVLLIGVVVFFFIKKRKVAKGDSN